MTAITASLVGCGRMGACHAQVLKKLDVTLLCVTDLNPSAAQKVLENWKLKPYPTIEVNLESS